VVGFEEGQREEGTKENAEREGRVQCVHHNRAILLPRVCLPDVSQLKMREPLSITPSLHQETNKLKLESTKIEPEHVKLPSFASRNQSNKAVYLILSRIHPPKIVHPNSKQFNFHCQRPKKLQSKTPNPRTATMP
jgi:hypothetical protein